LNKHHAAQREASYTTRVEKAMLSGVVVSVARYIVSAAAKPSSCNAGYVENITSYATADVTTGDGYHRRTSPHDLKSRKKIGSYLFSLPEEGRMSASRPNGI